MKIKSILLVVITSLILLSCQNKEKQNLTPEEELTLIPEVLEENKSDIRLSSFSKRYDSDIISKLYSEALDKDKNLNLLNKKIKEFTNDSVIEKTKSFTKYSNINNRYWNSVDRYISSINDIVLKKETTLMFNKLKLKYENRINSHTVLMDIIDKNKEDLRNQLTLMKLLVSEHMMRNYQVNEKPNIKELEELIFQYKKLIGESKEYTKHKK